MACPCHEFMMYLFLLTVFQISDDVLCMHIVPQRQVFQFQKVHLLLEATSEHSGKLSQVRFEETIFIIITIIIKFLINLQVQGHHPHQWAAFKVTH